LVAVSELLTECQESSDMDERRVEQTV